MGELTQLDRTDILDQNDWLNALEAAEDSAREREEAKLHKTP